MKPLLISSRDDGGGAARAAFRLFQGLRGSGLAARMVVKQAISRHPEVAELRIAADREYRRASSRYWMAQYALIDNHRSGMSNSWFSFPYPGFDLTCLPLVREAELFNLHWVAHFQSVESIGALLQTGKPVVWTLHDANPLTGGCHYPAGCRNFMDACRNCPQLETDPLGIPAAVLANKLRRWQGNLHIAAPSNWMRRMAQDSRVFGRYPVQVIPNAVDERVFRPHAREASRRTLGIPADGTAILFCAEAHNELRKGFFHLLESLKICAAKTRRSRRKINLMLLTVGKSDSALADLGLPVHELGYLHTEEEMARAYTAADIFVQPSLEDNLPNTVMEAQACGIAVAAFAAGGIPDMVRDGETGVLCPVGDAQALARALLRLAADSELRNRLGRKARQQVEALYRLEHQARAYGDLFQHLAPAGASSGRTWFNPARAELPAWQPQEDPLLHPIMRAADRRDLSRKLRHRLRDKRDLLSAEDRARIVKARLLGLRQNIFTRKAYALLRWCWRISKGLRR